MEEEVQKLVADFPQCPGANSRALRNLSEENWPDFLSASISILADGDSSQGARYLVALLMRENALQNALSDPVLLSISQAATIARLALSVERRFAVDFARSLSSFEVTDERQAEWILKILEEVSDSMQIQPTLAALLGHPSPRIRSKAALMIGRANGSADLAGEQLADEDPRIRANAVEALWRSDDPGCAAVYCDAARDPHQRVAGNAIVGLYKLNRVSSIRLLHELAARPGLAWQITAAWAMGITGSPHFQPALTRLVNAGDPQLRQHAVRSLSRIRQMIRISQLANEFTISLWPLPGDTEYSTKLVATVGAGSVSHVPNLPPTEFLLLEGERWILDYSVVEHSAPPAMAIWLLIPATGRAADPALLADLNRTRPKDRWCVEQFAPESSAALRLSPIPRASTGSGILHLDAPEIEITPDSDSTPAQGFTTAFNIVVKALLAAHGTRHLICVASASNASISFDGIKAEATRARRARVTIHAIVPSDGPCVQSAAECLEALCRDTGGGFYRISHSDEIPAVLRHIQLLLLDRYEISFNRTNPVPQNLTVRICSPRGYGETTTADSRSATGLQAGSPTPGKITASQSSDAPRGS